MARVGEPCDPSFFDCDDWDAWCNPETEKCERAAGIGEPCSGYEGCLLDGFCDGSICRPLGGVGDSCSEIGCLLYLICADGTCITPNEPCTLP